MRTIFLALNIKIIVSLSVQKHSKQQGNLCQKGTWGNKGTSETVLPIELFLLLSTPFEFHLQLHRYCKLIFVYCSCELTLSFLCTRQLWLPTLELGLWFVINVRTQRFSLSNETSLFT